MADRDAVAVIKTGSRRCLAEGRTLSVAGEFAPERPEQEMMMIKAAFAAVAALTVTSTVLAASPENPLAKDKVVLSLDKLDLATVDGQRSLAIRMDQAARAVCGDRLATVHLALDEQSRSCQDDVKAEIRSRIETRTASAQLRGAQPVQVALR